MKLKLILIILLITPLQGFAIWAVKGEAEKSCTALPGNLEEFLVALRGEGKICSVKETQIKGAFLMNCDSDEGYMLADSLNACEKLIVLNSKLEKELQQETLNKKTRKTKK